MNKWQTTTDIEICKGSLLLTVYAIFAYLVAVGCVLETLDLLSDYCRYDLQYCP